MAARTAKPSTVEGTVTATRESTVEEPTTAVAVPEPGYSDDALRSIASFDDALALVGETFGSIDDASDVLGDGFKLLKTDGAKSRLVGRPMILLEWSFYPGEFGELFAAIRVVAQEDNGTISKYIVNDGSSGVCKMLQGYTDSTGRRGGLVVRNGFRESQYLYCETCGTAKDIDDNHKVENPDHKTGRATTYYIDTSL